MKASKNRPPRPPTTVELQKEIDQLKAQIKWLGSQERRSIKVLLDKRDVTYTVTPERDTIFSRHEDAAVSFSQLCRRINEEIKKK